MKYILMTIVSFSLLFSCSSDNNNKRDIEIKTVRQGGNAKRDKLGIPMGLTQKFYKKLHKDTQATIDLIIADGGDPGKLLYSKLEKLETEYLESFVKVDSGIPGSNSVSSNTAAPPPYMASCPKMRGVEIEETVTEGSRMQVYSRLVDQSGKVLVSENIGKPVVVKQDRVVRFRVDQQTGNNTNQEQLLITDKSGLFIKQVAKVTLNDFNGTCVKEVTGSDRYAGRVAKFESKAQHKWQLGLRLIP